MVKKVFVYHIQRPVFLRLAVSAYISDIWPRSIAKGLGVYLKHTYAFLMLGETADFGAM